MGCFPEFWAPKELSLTTSIACALTGIVGFVGNLAILAVMVLDPLKELRSPFSYFLINLAVSDLVVAGCAMPISSYAHYKEFTGYIPKVLVKLIHISFFVSVTSSLLSLIALSVDRYVAITWAIKYREYLSWRRCFMVSMCIWVISLSFSLIYFLTGFIRFLMVFASVAILTGLVAITVTYVRIYLFFKNRTLQATISKCYLSTAADQSRLKRFLSEKKVTSVFLLILVVFIATYISAAVMIFVLQFCTACHCIVRHVLRDMQFVLISFNSSVNPFICTMRLKHFKRAMKHLWCLQPNQDITSGGVREIELNRQGGKSVSDALDDSKHL